MRRLLTFMILAAALLCTGAAPAGAASSGPVISIGVAPSKLQANLVPGQHYRTTLDIYNKGGSPVVLDVYLQDYTISPQSAVAFRAAGSLATSAAPWAQLDHRVLRVPAHGHGVEHLQVAVPGNAALGTHTL